MLSCQKAKLITSLIDLFFLIILCNALSLGKACFMLIEKIYVDRSELITNILFYVGKILII